MRFYAQILLAIGVGLSLAAGGHLKLETTADLGKLPASSGVNRGSFYAQNPWQYLGSDPDVHEFHYYFNREGTLRHRKVVIPHDAAVLEFPESPRGSTPRWVLLDTDQERFHFRMAPPQTPQTIRLKDLFPAGEVPPTPPM